MFLETGLPTGDGCPSWPTRTRCRYSPLSVGVRAPIERGLNR